MAQTAYRRTKIRGYRHLRSDGTTKKYPNLRDATMAAKAENGVILRIKANHNRTHSEAPVLLYIDGVEYGQGTTELTEAARLGQYARAARFWGKR